MDNLRIEEYKCIRTQIDSQSKLQVQVFIFSIISSSTLIGYFLKFFLTENINAVSTYVLLAPALIYIPSAYLIKDMRDEIYRWGTYIHVFIENENSQYYEGALSVIRNNYKSSESFNPMFTAYWAFSLICLSLWLTIYFTNKLEFECWLVLPWVIVFFIQANAQFKFNEIPTTKRKKYIEDWKSIKASSNIGNIIE